MTELMEKSQKQLLCNLRRNCNPGKNPGNNGPETTGGILRRSSGVTVGSAPGEISVDKK